jgi:hypothetical protein
MKLFLALFAVILAQLGWSQELKTYAVPDLGMSFSYPKSWGMSWNKRLEMTTFTIPLVGSGSAAKCEVFASPTRDSIEVWQEVQVRVNTSLKREVERQWQEEILGVPMLYTKVRYLQGSEPTVTPVGLLYASSPRKFHFRLTAPSASFDAAEAEWRNVLLSLRTASGALPTPEDPTLAPNVDPFKKPEKVLPPPPVVSLKPLPPSGRKTNKGEVRLSTKAGGNEVAIFMPKGWIAEWADGLWRLSRPGLSLLVTLEAASILDSPKPGVALSRAAAQSLTNFESVAVREEPKPIVNSAGANVAWVERVGKSPTGFLATIDAVGDSGDFYWRLTGQFRNEKAYRSEREELRKLMDRLSIEMSP